MKHNNVLLKALALVFVFALAIGCMFSCKTKDAIETLETELDNLEAEVAELAGLASAIDKVEDALESKDAALEEEIAKLAAKLEGVGENELAELVKNAATKAELEAALEEVKIAYTAKVDDLAAKVNKLDADLKAEVAALKSAFDDATDKIWDSVDDIAVIISVALGNDEDVVFDFAKYNGAEITGNAYYKTEEAKLVGLYDEYLFRLLRAQSVAQVDALIAQLKDKIAAMPNLLDTYQNMIATKKFTGNIVADNELKAEVDDIYNLLMGADEDAKKAMGYPEYKDTQKKFGLDPLELQKVYFDQAHTQLGVIRDYVEANFGALNSSIKNNEIFIWDLYTTSVKDAKTGEIECKLNEVENQEAYGYIDGLREAINKFQNMYLDDKHDDFVTDDYVDAKDADDASDVVFANISKFLDLSTQTDKNSFTYDNGKKYDKTYKLAINILNTLDKDGVDEAGKDVYVSYYSMLVYQENYYDNLKVAYEDFVADRNKSFHSYQVLKYVLDWKKGGPAPLFTQLKDFKSNLSSIDSWMKYIAPVADEKGAYDHADYEYQNLAYCLGLNNGKTVENGIGYYEYLLAAVDYAQKMSMIFNNETYTFVAAGENGEDVVVDLGAVKFETLTGDEETLTIEQIADIVASYKNTKLENIYVLDEDLLVYVPAVVSVVSHVNEMAEILIKDYVSTKDHNVQAMLGESDYKHFVDIQDRFGELRDAYNKIQAIVAKMDAKKGNVTFYDEKNILDEKLNWKVQIETILENFEIEDAKNVAVLTTDAYKLFDELVLEFNTLIANFDAIVTRAIELLELDTWAITLAKEIYAIQANLVGADDFDLEIAPSVIGDYETIGKLRDAFDNVVDAFEDDLKDAQIDSIAIKVGIDDVIEKYVENEDYKYVLHHFLEIKAVYDAINEWADAYLEDDADIAAALEAIAAFYVSADEDKDDAEDDALEIMNDDEKIATIAFNSFNYNAFMDVYTTFNAKYEAAAATWNILKDQMLALIATKSVHNIKDFEATLKALNTYFAAQFGNLYTGEEKKDIVVATMGDKASGYEFTDSPEYVEMKEVFEWIMVDEETEEEFVVNDKMLIDAFLDKMSATKVKIDDAGAFVANVNALYNTLINNTTLNAIDSADFNGMDVAEDAYELKVLIDEYFEDYCDCGDAKTCVTKAQMLNVNKVLYKAAYYIYANNVYTALDDIINHYKGEINEGDNLTDEEKAENAELEAEIKSLAAVQANIKAIVNQWDNVMVNATLTSVAGIYENAVDAIDEAIKDVVFYQ